MEVVHRRCAGLDVHKKTISACMLISGPGEEQPEVNKRTFGTFTSDLVELKNWLGHPIAARCGYAAAQPAAFHISRNCPSRRNVRRGEPSLENRDPHQGALARQQDEGNRWLPSKLSRMI